MRTSTACAGALVALGLLAGCERRTDPAEQRAQRVEQRGEQAAEEMRRQAGQAEQRAEQEAERIRREMEGREQPGVPAARGGGPLTLVQAQDQLAAARCDREQRCGSVGDGRRWTSREACVAAARAERAVDWESEACRSAGVNAQELNECLTELRGQDCGVSSDALMRLASCRAAEVCRH